ncbi:hypothetical protein ACIRPK_10745 [Kitasatospora sp. NPDC101801]|uniref:hypothetical protein n=1 Tax=Kitasatospora sp. NPDC101801 TaxID=3364103 RepID=UPI00382CF59B
MDKRNALRVGAVSAVATLMMLMTSPAALAATRDDGDDPGKGLSTVDTLALYVAAPLVLFAIIAGLVMLPSLGKGRKS